MKLSSENYVEKKNFHRKNTGFTVNIECKHCSHVNTHIIILLYLFMKPSLGEFETMRGDAMQPCLCIMNTF